jgi:hypothetical protein
MTKKEDYEKIPLMGIDNTLELQNNGYKGSVSAISEIIDNSIQANAKNIDVIIIKNTTKNVEEIEELLIVDDGDGMSKDVFTKALQFNSGTRSKANDGLGKYGQGLPNSSISQTKRVEVYTIKNDKILYNYIDLQEIYDSGEAYLPPVAELPKINIPLFVKTKKDKIEHGTIVRWVSPNKIKPKTAKTLADHIEKVAGRIFRYYINGYTDSNGKKYHPKINIIVYDFNGYNYEINENISRKSILAFDPMFLMKNTQMNNLFPEVKHGTSRLYPHKCIKTFDILNSKGEKIKTTVEIKLSYVDRDTRNTYGAAAGSTEFGKAYLKRNVFDNSGYNNISIIREGREIDCGNFGFIQNLAEINRWWSAEILFSPSLDSIAGVDNKKQHASAISYYDKFDLTEFDVHPIIIWISTYLHENIATVKKEITQQNEGVKKGGKGGGLIHGDGSSEKGDSVKDPKSIDDVEKEKIRKEFFDWVKARYPELSDKEIYEIVDYALSIKDNHIFVKSDLGENLYSYKVFGTKVLIEINYTHPFYTDFVKQFEASPEQEKSLRSIRLLIGSLVNSEIKNSTTEQSLKNDRRDLKYKFSTSLADYISGM